MVDPAQTALFLVIIVLTVLLLILGIQVFFILRELRQTVSKANRVLDNTGFITESVSRPISKLSSLVLGIKTGASFVQMFRKNSRAEKKSAAKLVKEVKNGKQQ